MNQTPTNKSNPSIKKYLPYSEKVACPLLSFHLMNQTPIKYIRSNYLSNLKCGLDKSSPYKECFLHFSLKNSTSPFSTFSISPRGKEEKNYLPYSEKVACFLLSYGYKLSSWQR